MRFYIIFYKLLIKEQDNALLIAENRCRTVQLYTYFQDLKKEHSKIWRGFIGVLSITRFQKLLLFLPKKPSSLRKPKKLTFRIAIHVFVLLCDSVTDWYRLIKLMVIKKKNLFYVRSSHSCTKRETRYFVEKLNPKICPFINLKG